MSDHRVGLVIPQTLEIPRVPAADDVGAFGREVEGIGYESLWMNEGWGSDAFVELTAVATATERIGVGTSIVNVFSRSPASLALAAATANRISGGRFGLGLGVGHPEFVEDIHGVPFERPIRRMHETIDIVKRLLGAADGTVSYEGELLTVEDAPTLDAEVPIYSAALGPANRRVAGRLADGWIPYHLPFPALESSFETVEAAAREAGRDPADVDVLPYVSAVVSEDRSAAREALRENIASYVGGFGDDYYLNAVGQAFEDTAEKVATAWRRGDEAGARAAVTEEMVDALGIADTPETAREKLGSLLERPVVDGVIVSVPHAVSQERGLETVRALAPADL